MRQDKVLLFGGGGLRGLVAVLVIHGGVASAAAPEEITVPIESESIKISTDNLVEQKLDEEGRAEQSSLVSDEDDKDYEYDASGGFPRLEGAIGGEAELDSTFAADDEANEQTETSISIYSSFDLSLTANLNLELDLSFESNGGDDDQHVFENQGAFVDTLAASYTGEIGGIKLGKFDLLDDIWDRGPGLFSNFQSEDLSLGEVIGVRAWFNLATFLESEHHLTGGVFYKDTTALSGALITGEDRLRKEDGGLANTEQLDNLVISLHGDELPFAQDWEYAVGFARQLAGENNSKNELSYFSGLYGEFDLAEDAAFSPFVEFLLRNGADGEDKTATTLLVGSSFERGPWTFGVSYSYRNTKINEDDDDEEDLENNKDNNVQLFASYTFPSDFYVDVGYQYLHEEDEDSYSIGVAIGYPMEFILSPSASRRAEPTRADRDRMRRKMRR